MFEVSAIRQGLIIDMSKEYWNETFSLYGFHFELITEIMKKKRIDNLVQFKFYIQVIIIIKKLKKNLRYKSKKF